ncbi:hypothetical protein BV898_09933 [Hypsibius exemplaris]|uniref:Uncharacterized protein n=1 Tax=Hypsibius exemplaris TaxID=2072580 RepID=A0A1W0WLF5_HYPEX|nr:hypothetical protein BV898_09933 [Hypsibius exemplaris]
MDVLNKKTKQALRRARCVAKILQEKEAAVEKVTHSLLSNLNVFLLQVCLQPGDLISTSPDNQARMTKKHTISARDISTSTSCKLLIPNELSRHAVFEGTRCTKK